MPDERRRNATEPLPLPLAGTKCGGYKPAVWSRSVAQPGSAPRSGRGGRRFKSCHSDQHLADFQTRFATGYATAWVDEGRTSRAAWDEESCPAPAPRCGSPSPGGASRCCSRRNARLTGAPPRAAIRPVAQPDRSSATPGGGDRASAKSLRLFRCEPERRTMTAAMYKGKEP